MVFGKHLYNEINLRGRISTVLYKEHAQLLTWYLLLYGFIWYLIYFRNHLLSVEIFEKFCLSYDRLYPTCPLPEYLDPLCSLLFHILIFGSFEGLFILDLDQPPLTLISSSAFSNCLIKISFETYQPDHNDCRIVFDVFNCLDHPSVSVCVKHICVKLVWPDKQCNIIILACFCIESQHFTMHLHISIPVEKFV